jgi:hypothetical protein
MGEYWAACQMMPGQEHIVRAKVEEADRGAFVPTFARMWAADGKVSAKECAAMSGYVFFRTNGLDWAQVEAIDGVQVLTMEGLDNKGMPARIAKPVTDEEMRRMVLGHATGEHDRIEACITQRKARDRNRRRRSRPGRRIRKLTVGNRTGMESREQINAICAPQ